MFKTNKLVIGAFILFTTMSLLEATKRRQKTTQEGLQTSCVGVKVELSSIPKVGEVFDVRITVYGREGIEKYLCDPKSFWLFLRWSTWGHPMRVLGGDWLEIVKGEGKLYKPYGFPAHAGPGYLTKIPELKNGQVREFSMKLRICKKVSEVGIGWGVADGPGITTQVKDGFTLYLLDSVTGQYGTKAEKAEKYKGIEYRYDAEVFDFIGPDPSVGQVNRKVIEMMRRMEPSLSDSEALLLHSDIMQVGIPQGIHLKKYEEGMLPGEDHEEVYKYYLRQGWLKAVRAGKREEWIQKMIKMREGGGTGINFFRPGTDSFGHLDSDSNKIQNVTVTFRGKWKFKDHLYNKDQGLLPTADIKPIDKIRARVFLFYRYGGIYYRRVTFANNITDTSGQFVVVDQLVPRDAAYLRACPMIYPAGPDSATPMINVSDPQITIPDYWKDPKDPTLYPMQENGRSTMHPVADTVIRDTSFDFGTVWTDTFPEVSQPQSGCINIYETYCHARTFIEPPPSWPLRVLWDTSYISATGYRNDTIWVVGEPTAPIEDTDEWDDDVLLHEFGHYLMNHYAESPPGYNPEHKWWRKNPPQYFGTAYEEGWATFFSGRARINTGFDSLLVNTFRGIGGGEAGWRNLEDPWKGSDFPPDSFQGGFLCEGAVAGVLWDIYDSKTEIPYPSYPTPEFPDTALADTVYEGIEEIWNIFDNYTQNGRHCWMISDLLRGWDFYGYGHEFGLNQILLHHRIRWIDRGGIIVPVPRVIVNNNSRKLRISDTPKGKRLHLVFLVEDDIYYAFSDDTGATWKRTNVGFGKFPALSLDRRGYPWVSYSTPEVVKVTRFNGQFWSSPIVVDIPCELAPQTASLVIDSLNYCHLSVDGFYSGLPGNLVYAFLDSSGIITEEIVVISSERCFSPSIALDPSGRPNIVYSKGDEIIQAQRIGPNNWSFTNISNTSTISIYPTLERHGDYLHTLWQEALTPTNFDILHSRISSPWVNVSNNPDNSIYPVIDYGHYALWQDTTTGNWEIFYSWYDDTAGRWRPPINLTNTSASSITPHITTWQAISGSKMVGAWVEGDSVPYMIKFLLRDVPSSPLLYIDLGDSIMSSYCLRRKGYLKFGTEAYKTVDYDNRYLRYAFKLNPEKDYRIDLSYYFEFPKDEVLDNDEIASPSETRDRNDSAREVIATPAEADRNDILVEGKDSTYTLVQRLKIDGVPLDLSYIKSGELKRVSVLIPSSLYADSEVIVDIEKVKRRYVVCGEIGIYEFEPEKKQGFAGGVQEDEASIIPLRLLFGPVYPNPTKGILKIRYGLHRPLRVEISVYDILGRLVKKIEDKTEPAGVYEVVWDAKALSQGIYFLTIVADKNRITEKIVLIE